MSPEMLGFVLQAYLKRGSFNFPLDLNTLLLLRLLMALNDETQRGGILEVLTKLHART